MSNSRITVIRGDDYTLNTTFKDSEGEAYDITGSTVFFTVKRNLEDEDDDALISKDVTSHTDPTNGITQVVLTDTDTDLEEGQYYYDFQLKNSDGNVNSTRRGTFEVLKDVTTRTS